ncbi:glycosyltransferase family 2 protein [Peribacillus frigoritolerans]|uniref:glycosyltransferase family 2 protein n=1 Tax=Peribacillus frigoritolerans TaxID=450367 RepID=UPI001F50152B|nr:glycosyltransferase family 2 protein [Peribacillus frigoritolerans]MCK2018299.1 glycosyltransferase family 2 protein [Peribacillus frigoritolerans]
MMESKVTVVIPFYNPGAYILEALDSVYAQTYKDWKIILIDDGSTDDTVAKIKDYLEDPRIKLVRHSQNMGQSKSMNSGLNLVETPFLIQLDADDWFYPYTLEVLLKETKKVTNPDEIAVFSGNINLVYKTSVDSEATRNSKKFKFNPTTKKLEWLKPRVKSRVIKGRSFQERYEFLLANSSVWPRFYRTTALQLIGGWPVDDPYEGRYAEDIRVLSRLIEHYRFHCVDKALLNHRRHNKNQTNNIQVYRDIMEWIVWDSLKRWGDEYEPIFTTKAGWTSLTGLRPKSKD